MRLIIITTLWLIISSAYVGVGGWSSYTANSHSVAKEDTNTAEHPFTTEYHTWLFYPCLALNLIATVTTSMAVPLILGYREQHAAHTRTLAHLAEQSSSFPGLRGPLNTAKFSPACGDLFGMVVRGRIIARVSLPESFARPVAIVGFVRKVTGVGILLYFLLKVVDFVMSVVGSGGTATLLMNMWLSTVTALLAR